MGGEGDGGVGGLGGEGEEFLYVFGDDFHSYQIIVKAPKSFKLINRPIKGVAPSVY